MPDVPDSLSDFDAVPVTLRGSTKTVYRKGTGPAVIVMAEIPGITPKVADFARAVVASGCSVALPHLFGVPGADVVIPKAIGTMLRQCISKEFTLFAREKSSPVVDWLRELAALEHERCGGPGVGAVGMCLTGGFALAMTTHPSVIAPVLSQPSLPVPLGPLRRRNARSIDTSRTDLARVRQRMIDENFCALGFRYSSDPFVPGERFEYLAAELGDRFIGRTFPSTSVRDHSVLTEQLQQEALDDVLRFFQERLGVRSSE